MRIVVSGTHASGKSTLIGDLLAERPGFAHLGDPFELVDGALDEPDAGTYAEQLLATAVRLRAHPAGDDLVAERGPIDFLAYLSALDVLRRGGRSRALFERGYALTGAAMQEVDLLVVLPLEHRDPIEVGEDEDPELREAMDDALLELVDDPDLVAPPTRVVELSGDREARLRALLAVLDG
ncbi:AAA family ATPase [Agromyces soli]|uniref:ATP-binding protein n=1 Tax=Agromyces soli TaxID=659012 RepID=A0ABY4AW39_9MICO|nr:AAA family ATPase [Agromyces soli]UOE26356.1 ATP-binding protein [Agromyces soli]